MPPHSPHFLLKQLVPEPTLKLARTLTGRRHAHRVLSAAEDDVWPKRGDTCRVERRFGRIQLHLVQCRSVP